MMLAAACLAISSLPAQSFFSMRGFGEEIYASNAASTGLGGLTVLSPRNPAFPINATKTNFTVGAMLLANYGSDGVNRRLIGDGRPDFFRAQVPLPVGFHLGFGFSEWYNQDFEVYSESTAAYRRYVAGKGGIYDLFASLSRSFGNYAAIGVQYSGLLGSSNELWRFDAFQGGYVTYDSVDYTYRGDALRVGALGRLPFIRFSRTSDSSLALGAFYEQVLDFELEAKTRTHGVAADSVTLPVKFPFRYGVGLTAFPTPLLKLSVEGTFQKASQTTIGGLNRPYFRDARRVSLGGEYLYAERYPLRLGLRWQDTYLATADSSAIREIGVTAGSSLRIADLGTFDYALEYVNRTGGKLSDNILRAQLSLYFEEPWKKRTRNWGY